MEIQFTPSNREIIDQSAGPHQTTDLVYKVLVSVNRDLTLDQMFHTDWGIEFENKLIDEALETFDIKKSWGMKGCPYADALAEAMFNVIETEFTNQAHFNSLDQLIHELNDYVNCYNNIRIHGTLGYITPLEYRIQTK